jgi:HD-like signal output (HDOD) protein
MNNPNVESEEIVGLLKQDPPVVAQVIRMANSVAYSPAEPVDSLDRALATVGFSEVHRLVGAVASAQLSELDSRLYPIEGAKLRLNALFVAVLMEELARWANEKPHTCYAVGLLRSIGIMTLERLSERNTSAIAFKDSGQAELDVWEQEQFGITNPEAAFIILTHWRLPAETANAIRFHYHPAGRHNPVIHLLMLAASAAADRYYGIPGEDPYWKLSADTFAKAGLTLDGFRMACEKAHKTYERIKVAVA